MDTPWHLGHPDNGRHTSVEEHLGGETRTFHGFYNTPTVSLVVAGRAGIVLVDEATSAEYDDNSLRPFALGDGTAKDAERIYAGLLRQAFGDDQGILAPIGVAADYDLFPSQTRKCPDCGGALVVLHTNPNQGFGGDGAAQCEACKACFLVTWGGQCGYHYIDRADGPEAQHFADYTGFRWPVQAKPPV